MCLSAYDAYLSHSCVAKQIRDIMGIWRRSPGVWLISSEELSNVFILVYSGTQRVRQQWLRDWLKWPWSRLQGGRHRQS